MRRLGSYKEKIEDKCANCGDFLATPLQCCSKCRVSHYCSPECQREHWDKEHSRECFHLRRIRKNDSTLSTDRLQRFGERLDRLRYLELERNDWKKPGRS
jgi:hypothetical protein